MNPSFCDLQFAPCLLLEWHKVWYKHENSTWIHLDLCSPRQLGWRTFYICKKHECRPRCRQTQVMKIEFCQYFIFKEQQFWDFFFVVFVQKLCLPFKKKGLFLKKKLTKSFIFIKIGQTKTIYYLAKKKHVGNVLRMTKTTKNTKT